VDPGDIVQQGRHRAELGLGELELSAQGGRRNDW
jgi:hypothetical protein